MGSTGQIPLTIAAPCLSPEPRPGANRLLTWLVPKTPLPLDDRRAPGQARAKDEEQNQIAALDSAGSHRFIQGNGDGGGGGVAVFVQVDEDLLRVSRRGVRRRRR